MGLKRIEYLDAIKGFAIFLVLWGHCIQFLSNNNCFNDKAFSLIYSFHMPLFMMICGFFFPHSLNKETKLFLTQTIRRFLLPIILCGALLVLVSELLNGTFNLKTYFHCIPMIPFTQYWFLRDVLIFYILTYFSYKYFKSYKSVFIICLLLIFTLPNKLWGGWMNIFSPISSSTLFMFPYFWFGIFLNKYYSTYKLHKFKLLYISLITYVSLLCLWNGNYTYYQTPVYSLFTYNNGLEITLFNHFSISLLRYAIGLFGSLCIWCLFDVYSSYFKQIPIISSIGKNTLGIYIVQTFIIEQLINHFVKLEINIYIYDWIITPGIALLLTFIINYFVNILKRNKYSAVLIGFY